MEKKRGLEALKNLPFRDVVLPFEQAVDVLTKRTKIAYGKNLDYLITLLNPQHPDYQQVKAKIVLSKNNLDQEIDPGGFSFSKDDLQYVYQNWGNMSFHDVVKKLMEEKFPKLFEGYYKSENERNPAHSCLGYLLDLLEIQNPEISNYEDGVKTIIEVMRIMKEVKYGINPFILGSMVDDGLNLRPGKGISPIELFMDKDEVRKFNDVYWRLASVPEKLDYLVGLKITIGDIQFGDTGFSAS